MKRKESFFTRRQRLIAGVVLVVAGASWIGTTFLRNSAAAHPPKVAVERSE